MEPPHRPQRAVAPTRQCIACTAWTSSGNCRCIDLHDSCFMGLDALRDRYALSWERPGDLRKTLGLHWRPFLKHLRGPTHLVSVRDNIQLKPNTNSVDKTGVTPDVGLGAAIVDQRTAWFAYLMIKGAELGITRDSENWSVFESEHNIAMMTDAFLGKQSGQFPGMVDQEPWYYFNLWYNPTPMMCSFGDLGEKCDSMQSTESQPTRRKALMF